MKGKQLIINLCNKHGFSIEERRDHFVLLGTDNRYTGIKQHYLLKYIGFKFCTNDNSYKCKFSSDSRLHYKRAFYTYHNSN